MTNDRVVSTEPRLREAIAELQALIAAHYPSVRFSVDEGTDPTAVYVTATVDVEDADEVVDLYIDRLVDLQLEHGLALHVVPVRPVERVIETLREQESSRRPVALPL